MAARSRLIPVDWSVQVITVGGMAIPVARLLVSSCFPLIGSGRISLPELCWLDTGCAHLGYPVSGPSPTASLAVAWREDDMVRAALRPGPSRYLVQRGAWRADGGPVFPAGEVPVERSAGRPGARSLGTGVLSFAPRASVDRAGTRQGTHPTALIPKLRCGSRWGYSCGRPASVPAGFHHLSLRERTPAIRIAFRGTTLEDVLSRSERRWHAPRETHRVNYAELGVCLLSPPCLLFSYSPRE